MKIKRYAIWSRKEREYVYVEAKETFDGEYVKWDDVEKLIALRTAEAAELDLRRHAELSGYYARATLANALNNTNAARRAANIKESGNG